MFPALPRPFRALSIPHLVNLSPTTTLRNPITDDLVANFIVNFDLPDCEHFLDAARPDQCVDHAIARPCCPMDRQ